MESSEYQKAIYEWINNGSGSARVNAVAGSGKTTTIINASGLISRTARFCAFNKHIEKELSKKLPKNVSCKTIHSIGLEAVKNHFANINIEPDKYNEIITPFAVDAARDARSLTSSDKDILVTVGTVRKALKELTNMAMLTLTDANDPDAIDRMRKRYSINVPEEQRPLFYELVPKIIESGENQTRDGVVDFNDMVYYPAKYDINIKKSHWLFVDEAQDLSASQLSIVTKCLKNNGRMIAVGDPLQSIYGFTGADPFSFNRIGAYTDVDLPLSVCYRCDKKIVQLAQLLVPQMEWGPNAGQGTVGKINSNDLPNYIKATDMVICRLNSPLVKECVRLTRAGIKGYIKGKDVMKQFVDIVESVESNSRFTWSHFSSIMWVNYQRLETRLLRDGDRTGVSYFNDLYTSVDEIRKGYDCRSAKDLIGKIRMLFRETDDSVVFSTIHKAKGLESSRVFIIKPSQLRLRWKGQEQWQKYQEQCCEYVAITRAKKELYFVHGQDETDYKIGARIELGEI